MNLTKRQLTVYALGHFWMDLSCALLLFSRLGSVPEFALCILLYNFCAFALQMPIGLMADQLSRNSCLATLGCVLTALGWGCTGLPLLAATVAGVGNACFHVGGGVDVLNVSQKKAVALGVFVAPGALGIFWGTVLGRSGVVPGWLPVLGLVCFGFLFVWLDLRLRGTLNSGNAAVELAPDQAVLGALACCFLAILLYAYVDTVRSFSWETRTWAIVVALAVSLGKASGGFLGDKLGMKKALVCALGLSAVLFCFSNVPLAGVAAVLLLNTTITIALWAAARLLPGAKGFSYGMLKFALFLGFLLVYLEIPIPMQSGLGYALGAVATLGLLFLSLKRGGLK